MPTPCNPLARPQATLRDSISMLLMRLLDDRGLLQFEEGATLVKAVNVLMLKLLEAGNRTYAFAALLQLLRDPPAEAAAGGPDALPRFYDLVVKCLIKLTKSLQVSMEVSEARDKRQGGAACLHAGIARRSLSRALPRARAQPLPPPQTPNPAPAAPLTPVCGPGWPALLPPRLFPLPGGGRDPQALLRRRQAPPHGEDHPARAVQDEGGCVCGWCVVVVCVCVGG